MARPKVQKDRSSAFDEKSIKERDKLQQRVSVQLKQDIAKLLDEGLQSDLTILTQNTHIAVHKCILKTRGREFYDTVLHNPESEIVTLSCDLEVLQQVLRYLYYEDDTSLVKDLVQQLAKTDAGGETTELSQTSHPDPGDDPQQMLINTDDDVKEPPTARSVVVELSKENISPAAQAHIQPVDDMPETGSALRQDFLRLLEQEAESDIVINVAGRKYKCHRCILVARSTYFSAMLSGSWKESQANEVLLEGISSNGFEKALKFIYGGVVDLSEGCDMGELLAVADMYGVDGLKEVVGFILRRDKCHFFHKPCSECQYGVVEVLLLAYTYGVDWLWERSVRWCKRHLVRVWSSKQFATIPEEISAKCLQSAIKDIKSDTVLETVMECDRLMGNLSSVSWSKPVVVMTTKLMEACMDHMRQNLPAILEDQKFISLGSTMALGLGFLEDVISRVIMTLHPSRACASYISVQRLATYAFDETCIWNEDFRKLALKLQTKMDHYMTQHINQVIATPEWKTILSPETHKKITDGALYVSLGEETRQVRARPRLSSSNTAEKQKAAIRRRVQGKQRTEKVISDTRSEPGTAKTTRVGTAGKTTGLVERHLRTSARDRKPINEQRVEPLKMTSKRTDLAKKRGPLTETQARGTCQDQGKNSRGLKLDTATAQRRTVESPSYTRPRNGNNLRDGQYRPRPHQVRSTAIPSPTKDVKGFHQDPSTDLDLEAQGADSRTSPNWRSKGMTNLHRLSNLPIERAETFHNLYAASLLADEISVCQEEANQDECFVETQEIAGEIFNEEPLVPTLEVLFKKSESSFF